MPLVAGQFIGPYEIVSALGAGGMGEVYRARDPKLKREVAVKVLPAAVAADHDRLARFQREAEVLASLNHPNIAHIYGIEDTALVMELVEGEDLAQRLARGAMPLDEALPIARQLAEALEAAHARGIVHRDLKPANIKVRPDGTVKVLDFGLAKAMEPTDPSGQSDVANSPTLTARATRIGMILGTAAYMAPEQARGHPVDRRVDVWAFGCVLYEMLTGRPVFGGDDVTDVLAAVVRAAPEWAALPADTPAALRRLLRRCLEKDPRRRLHDIADARIELDDVVTGPPESDIQGATPGPAALRPRVRERIAWIVAGASLVALVAALTLVRQSASDDIESRARTYTASLVLPDDMRLSDAEPSGRFALSPDGRSLALVASDAQGQTRLWVRPLDSAVAQPLAGTEGALHPFWSPDSRFIAFLAAGKLRKVEATGGPVVMLCDASLAATGSWSKDDNILFTPAAGSALHRVSASGGTPTPATTLDVGAGDVQHWYPWFLPDGRHFLYFVVGSTTRGVADPRAVYLGSLEQNEPARLLIEEGSNAKYANGHLVYLRNGRLVAQPFDIDHLTLTGSPVPLAEQVLIAGMATTGVAAAFTVSDTGLLAYQTGSAIPSQLTWFDRGGRRLSTLGDTADHADVVLSPDGTRAAVSVLDPGPGTRDIWLFDLARGIRERFTFDPGDDFAPVWLSSKGDHLIFSSRRQGRTHLYRKPLDGTTTEAVLVEDALGKFASSTSADGQFLAYVAGGGIIRRSDVWVVPLAGDREPYPLLQTPFVESQPQFSPDGRWLAYMANESGRPEVYVRPFGREGTKAQVSSAGGGWPRWRRDGKEIFYLALDGTLTAVPVDAQGARFDVGIGRPLFAVRTRPQARLDAYNYDVVADGGRFLVNAYLEQPTTSITLVVNWAAALK